MDPAVEQAQPQQPAQPEPPDPAKIQQDQMKAQNEALKAQVALHSSTVEVAKAVSDAYYKIDAVLTKMTPDSDVWTRLKSIRDAIFIQKGQVDQVVQMASGGTSGQQAQPVAPPPTAAPVAQAAPAAGPAPIPTRATPLPAPQPQTASKEAASVPSMQAEKVWGWLQQGKPGSAGSLATDGKVVTLRGRPIFKVENGLAFGSFAGDPSLTTAANVNSLAVLAGIGRVFALHHGTPSFNGTDIPADGWVAVGVVKSGTAPEAKAVSLPSLLQRRVR